VAEDNHFDYNSGNHITVSLVILRYLLCSCFLKIHTANQNQLCSLTDFINYINNHNTNYSILK
jgi:hypothetical protein